MQVTKEGSVRVDLLGGTLDLEPINLILPRVVTLNVATKLKAKVEISPLNDSCGIEIISRDYHSQKFFKEEAFNFSNLYEKNFFGALQFVAQILDLVGVRTGIKIELSSGAPVGSGLGGSSAMGMTLYRALLEGLGQNEDLAFSVRKIRGVEGRILNAGQAGYQDYYPALLGGILALKARPEGEEVEQLYSQQLARYLEERLTLVFSGESRLSGINNWEVYKAFFDGDKRVREGLIEIARLSDQAYQGIKNNDYDSLAGLISAEGQKRCELFENILTPSMKKIYTEMQNHFEKIGIKTCGAGGGGCFLLIHRPEDGDGVKQRVRTSGMKVCDFSIDQPLQQKGARCE